MPDNKNYDLAVYRIEDFYVISKKEAEMQIQNAEKFLLKMKEYVFALKS